jgi:hypothetical protein
MYDPKELFNRWYVTPLRMLESLPNGNGGFIALAISCALYERYATAVIEKSGGKATKEAKLQQLMHDFNTDKASAKAFWDTIRDGLVHQAMPLQKKKHPRWRFEHSYLEPFELVDCREDGRPILEVQPWKFMNAVISLCEKNLSLLMESESFPWGNTNVPDL